MASLSPACAMNKYFPRKLDTLFSSLYEINLLRGWYFNETNIKNFKLSFYVILTCNLFCIVTFYNVMCSCEIPSCLSVFYLIKVYRYIKGESVTGDLAGRTI